LLNCLRFGRGEHEAFGNLGGERRGKGKRDTHHYLFPRGKGKKTTHQTERNSRGDTQD